MPETVRVCQDCGDGEEDANLTYCIACDKTICEDNCVAATNDEHGVSWCHECYERESPGWVAMSEDED
jgi:hypothetical protein